MRSYVVTDVVLRLERDRDLEGRDRDLDRERLLVSALLEVLDDFRLDDDRRLSARNNKTPKTKDKNTEPILKKSTRPDDPTPLTPLRFELEPPLPPL